MRRRPKRLVFFWALGIALGSMSLPGCGVGGAAPLEVKGKIYLGNDPLKATGLDQAQVHFDKPYEEGKPTEKYSGTFDDEGNYAIKVPPGKYVVTVVATKMKAKGAKS